MLLVMISFLNEVSSYLGTVTNKCHVKKLSSRKFKIILTQGLNRQIRRMCEYLGYHVKELKRVRIMNINLDVKVGQWRHLTKKELLEMNKALVNSRKLDIITEFKVQKTTFHSYRIFMKMKSALFTIIFSFILILNNVSQNSILERLIHNNWEVKKRD